MDLRTCQNSFLGSELPTLCANTPVLRVPLDRREFEVLSWADTTVVCLDKIVGQRGGHPAFIRCDDGPELTANAVRDWCRFGGAGASYIEPGSPWENPWVESYGGRMRDELLGVEQFDTLLEAQVLVADWRSEYNLYRPHSALDMLTPVEFADQWRHTNQPQLS